MTAAAFPSRVVRISQVSYRKCFRTGLIEAWGRGYERMAAACRDQETPEPTVESDGNGVWLKWAWVNPTSDADRIRSRDGVGGNQRTPPVTQPVAPPVTDPVVRLLNALEAGPRGGIELRAHLGLRDKKHLRERYINRVLEAGFVEMTIPDKPNSRLQTYRLTRSGRARLAAARKRTRP